MTSANEHKTATKGLEGVVAAETELSLVDGANSKLYYRGIFIQELVEHSTFEETVFFLWNGKLPSKEELEQFKQKLVSNRKMSEGHLKALHQIPKTAHPMAMLRTMVSYSGVEDEDQANITQEGLREKAFRLTGVIPTIIAAFHRLRQGKGILEPKAELDHAANFLYMLNGEEPNSEMIRALDAYLILLADHGLNASTFAARVTCATQSDMYSAITSAVGTLKGDLHGSANQRAMEMILDIAEPENVESYVGKLFAEKKKVMGFGHRIYKTADPRATAFRAIAQALCEKNNQQKWMDISNRVEKKVWDEKQIPCNVDFFSASVLYILGFPIDCFTTVFAASRVAGWTAHVIEQLKDNRLIRPSADYTGPRDQSYTPIEKRTS